ncbi:MAG: hypothetical protein AAB588_06535 [Patescibacteria group bacterium]
MKYHLNSTSAVIAVFVFVIGFGGITYASTISTNISTAKITASDNVDFTFGGTKRLLIDATSPDTTVTSGIVDLNIDASSSSGGAIKGMDMLIANNGGRGIQGYVFGYTGAAALIGSDTTLGYLANIAGNTSDASGSQYYGFGTLTTGSNGGSADYVGYTAVFDSSQGGSSLTTNGNASGVELLLNKTAGGGSLLGGNFQITNSSASTGSLYALDAQLVQNGSATGAAGARVRNTGSNAVADGIIISGQFTEGVDVSGINGTTGLQLGTKSIASTGSTTIDLVNASNDQLTLTNSGAGAASLTVEGSISSSSGGGTITLGATDVFQISATEPDHTSNSVFSIAADLKGQYTAGLRLDTPQQIDTSGTQNLNAAIIIGSPTSTSTESQDYFYGLTIDNLSGAGNPSEYAINVGTSWDRAINVASPVVINSQLMVYDNGAVPTKMAANGAIAITRSYIRVCGSNNGTSCNVAVTLANNPAVTEGVLGGQVLIIEGTDDTNTVTVNDGVNTQLGAASRALGQNDTLTLIYNGADWLEVAFVNN